MNAITYLVNFHPKVIPALKELLKDDDAEVRKFAKQWLDKLEKEKELKSRHY